MTIQTETRNADLGDLVSLLSIQHESKLDGVVPAQGIESRGGILHIAGMGQDGPVGPAGQFRPTAIMDGHIAERLSIPVKYLRRLREERIDLYDANVNGWLRGESFTLGSEFEPDPRSFLVRTFADPDGGIGVGRAVLSDTYKPMDNLDCAAAVLKGLQDAGVDARVLGCDLSESRMAIRILCPEVKVLAEDFLKDYRNPFGNGNDPYDHGGLSNPRQVEYLRARGFLQDDGDPWVAAGFVATNGETGGSAWSICPRFFILTCTNGAMITRDIVRAVHLGSKLEEGVVQWSSETHQKAIDLITSKTADAVKTFVNVDYMRKVIEELSAKAARKLEDPAKAVELVSTKLKFTEAEQAGIFNAFISGGQVTTGGIFQAVTAFAQTVADPDRAYELESVAVEALEVAFAAA